MSTLLLNDSWTGFFSSNLVLKALETAVKEDFDVLAGRYSGCPS